jgi:hypothetical protein
MMSICPGNKPCGKLGKENSTNFTLIISFKKDKNK